MSYRRDTTSRSSSNTWSRNNDSMRDFSSRIPSYGSRDSSFRSAYIGDTPLRTSYVMGDSALRMTRTMRDSPLSSSYSLRGSALSDSDNIMDTASSRLSSILRDTNSYRTSYGRDSTSSRFSRRDSSPLSSLLRDSSVGRSDTFRDTTSRTSYSKKDSEPWRSSYGNELRGSSYSRKDSGPWTSDERRGSSTRTSYTKKESTSHTSDTTGDDKAQLWDTVKNLEAKMSDVSRRFRSQRSGTENELETKEKNELNCSETQQTSDSTKVETHMSHSSLNSDSQTSNLAQSSTSQMSDASQTLTQEVPDASLKSTAETSDVVNHSDSNLEASDVQHESRSSVQGEEKTSESVTSNSLKDLEDRVSDLTKILEPKVSDSQDDLGLQNNDGMDESESQQQRTDLESDAHLPNLHSTESTTPDSQFSSPQSSFPQVSNHQLSDHQLPHETKRCKPEVSVTANCIPFRGSDSMRGVQQQSIPVTIEFHSKESIASRNIEHPTANAMELINSGTASSLSNCTLQAVDKANEFETKVAEGLEDQQNHSLNQMESYMSDEVKELKQQTCKAEEDLKLQTSESEKMKSGVSDSAHDLKPHLLEGITNQGHNVCHKTEEEKQTINTRMAVDSHVSDAKKTEETLTTDSSKDFATTMNNTENCMNLHTKDSIKDLKIDISEPKTSSGCMMKAMQPSGSHEFNSSKDSDSLESDTVTEKESQTTNSGKDMIEMKKSDTKADNSKTTEVNITKEMEEFQMSEMSSESKNSTSLTNLEPAASDSQKIYDIVKISEHLTTDTADKYEQNMTTSNILQKANTESGESTISSAGTEDEKLKTSPLSYDDSGTDSFKCNFLGEHDVESKQLPVTNLPTISTQEDTTDGSNAEGLVNMKNVSSVATPDIKETAVESRESLTGTDHHTEVIMNGHSSSEDRTSLIKDMNVLSLPQMLRESSVSVDREWTPMRGGLRTRNKALKDVMTIHEAAATGDVPALEKLLEEPEADIEATDERERTALHLAADRGQLGTVTVLLKHGSNVNRVDFLGRTALHYGVESGEVDVVEALLNAGAVTDITETRRGRTPFHLATLATSLDILKLLLQPLIDDPWEGRKVMSLGDKDGRTLLHLAANSGQQEVADVLLSAGAEVNGVDLSGNSPMHAAILARQRGKDRVCTPLLELLLDCGGQVDAGVGGEVGSLAHAAATIGCLYCLKLLTRRGAPLDCEDSMGRTPLHVAIAEEQEDVVNYLVDQGASLEVRDKRGQCAIHHAILVDSPSLVIQLLVAGADKNSRDRDGKTFFQFAVIKRKYKVLQAMAKRGMTYVGDGQLALHYCACVGSLEAASVLLDCEFNINETDDEGRMALHHAICAGHENIVNFLINYGCSIRRADNTGATPLHYAVRWGGSDALLRRLVKKEGNVSATDRLGRTPLHYAASKSANMSDMYILINNGAKINTTDDRGLTPLHLAARLGNESLVRILLDNDARHDIPDCDNFLPIDHAREKNHVCILKRLENYELKKQREQDPRFGLYTRKKDEDEVMIQSRYKLDMDVHYNNS